MADKAVLWAYQQIHEPHQCAGGWKVCYKENNVWKEKEFPEHEKAYDFYWKQYENYMNFYNVFLRELGVKQR